MVYGYARVSTKEQNVDRQLNALSSYDESISIQNETLFIDKVSGKTSVDDREEYRVLRRVMRQGDELVIDALDRLGRTKKIIKDELEYLNKKGIIIRVLSLPTTLIKEQDAQGQGWVFELVNTILLEVYSSLAQEELEIKERRQRAGIEAAKAKGVYRGRKPIKINHQQLENLYPRWKAKEIRTSEMMTLLGLKTSTFYRTIRAYEEEHHAGN